MFACCSRCRSPVLLRRLRDSSPCFVRAFSFFEYLPQPWFVTHVELLLQKIKCKKNAFHRWGIEKQRRPHVNVKSDVLQSSLRWGRWLCAATRTVVLFYALFRDIFGVLFYTDLWHLPYMCAINAAQCFTFALVVFCFGSGGPWRLMVHKPKSCFCCLRWSDFTIKS